MKLHPDASGLVVEKRREIDTTWHQVYICAMTSTEQQEFVIDILTFITIYLLMLIYFITRQLSFFSEWIKGEKQWQASNLSRVATQRHG